MAQGPVTQELEDKIDQKFMSNVNIAGRKLQKIWDDFNLNLVERSKSLELMVVQLNLFLDDLVKKEELLVITIEKMAKEITLICTALNLQSYSPTKGISLMQAKKQMGAKLVELMVEKRLRVDRLKELRLNNETLSSLLGHDPFVILNDSDLSEAFMAKIVTHTEGLIVEKKKRLKCFETTKHLILDLFLELDAEPTAEQQSLYAEENLILSLDTLEKLNNLQKQLETARDAAIPKRRRKDYSID